MPLLSLADEFSDQFSMESRLSESALEKLANNNWTLPEPSNRIAQTDSVAVIPVFGILTDRRTIGELIGAETSYESIAACLLYCQQAGVRNVVLDVNSPGGYASGVLNLTTIIQSVRSSGCRITAVVNSLCCSAAYRIACACDEIVAIPESIIGSIGVNYIMTDTSRQAAIRGQETVVISTSEYKWAGTPGTPVTERQKENIRINMVEPFYQTFCQEVKTSRHLTDKELKAVSDGRSFRAEEALELKLIDRISTFADAIQSVGMAQKKGLVTMAKEEKAAVETAEIEKPIEEARQPEQPAVQTAPVAASLTQLDESFPHASAEFKLGQLRAKATLDAAKDAYISMLENKLAVAQAAVVTAPEPEPEKPAQTLTLPGAPALEKTDAAMPEPQLEESVSERLKKIIDEKVVAGMSQNDAAVEALRENPELRKEWIDSVNAR